MPFRPWQALQRSFRTKLLLALLGTVGLLVALALLVVRYETAQQIRNVTSATVEQADTAFRQAEKFQRSQLAQLAAPFTRGVRIGAMLAAVEAGAGGDEISYIRSDIQYQLSALQIPSSIVVLTGPDARPLFALRDAQELDDDVDLGPALVAVRGIIESDEPDRFGYVRVGDRLYSAQTLPIFGDEGLVGGALVGIQVDSALASDLGAVAAVEICFVVDGECVVGTPGARASLAPALVAAAERGGSDVVETDGERWSVAAAPLVPDRPREGSRVVAKPLEAVLAPFDHVKRALALGGVAALVLAVAISFVLSRGFTRPVHALVDATTRVAHGDFEARVDVRSQDEMGRLAAAFNEMTHGLLLKEQYRGVLDKVVSPEIAEELLRADIVLGGENREVTTVFGDLVGFTALTEGMEPQQVIGLLNECMERLSRAIEGAGGVIDKYVGDEIMAVFGAPVPQQDHARRALVAADGMIREMAALNRQRAKRGAQPLHLSVGVHSGVVVAGNMGSADRLNYTVLGEAVNLAARLCQNAGRDEILVSSAVLDRAGGIAMTSRLGTRLLKGFSSPIEVFRVEAVDVAAAGIAPRSVVRAPASSLA